MRAVSEMKTRKREVALAILTVFSLFSFAFITNEAVHEAGHWLAHASYGSHVRVLLDPFGGSRILGGADSTAPATVTSLAGPLFSLLFASLIFTVLWHRRGPISAPFLFMLPVALIQEGVTFSLGLLTPGGDAAHVAAFGIPTSVVALFGVFLLFAGIAALTLVLPLAGVSHEDRFEKNLLLIGTGMIALMLLRFTISTLRQSGPMVEAAVPLVFSTLLALAVAASFSPVHRILGGRVGGGIHCAPTRSSTGVSLALAAFAFGLQMVILN